MILLALLVVILLAAVIYLRWVYTRLDKYGIKYLKPIPLVGNMLEVMLGKQHIALKLQELYNKYCDESQIECWPAPDNTITIVTDGHTSLIFWKLFHKSIRNSQFTGLYDSFTASIHIYDPELIKKITIKDFEHFIDRKRLVDDKIDAYFGRILFAMKGHDWKDMRSTLSPAFTSSKMRHMVPFMVEVNEQMIRALKRKIKESETGYVDVECKDLTTRYANDVIASCAFGLKLDSHSETNNDFYTMGKMITKFDYKVTLIMLGYLAMPELMKKLNIKILGDKTTKFFKNLVMNNMQEREMHNIFRPDMIHLLMEAKKGKLRHEGKDTNNPGFATAEESEFGTKTIDREWSDSDLVAQAIQFVFAGFETVSTTMSFLLYELACNPDVQERLLEEIRENDAKNGGKFDYDSIQSLKYLDMVMSEVLRLWPPVFGLVRECVKDYNIGRANDKATLDYVVRKGQGIAIPVWPIHRDARLFPNPDKFDPERFSNENKATIKPFSYMPFGVGPRNCIGSRFALCEVKVMAYLMVQQLEISPCERTTIPPKLDKSTFNIVLKGGAWLRVKDRRH